MSFIASSHNRLHLLLMGPSRGHLDLHEAGHWYFISRQFSIVVCLKRLHAVERTQVPQLSHT